MHTVITFLHHNWIGGFVLLPELTPRSLVRDYDPTNNYNNLLDRVIRQRDAMISHKLGMYLLGFHSFGLYIHNDTCIRASS
jgi:photosystem I P700 chlorophyll a apoprotein A1